MKLLSKGENSDIQWQTNFGWADTSTPSLAHMLSPSAATHKQSYKIRKTDIYLITHNMHAMLCYRLREIISLTHLVMWSARGGSRGVAGALSSEGRSFLKLVFGVETLGALPPGVWAREAGRLLCTLLKLLLVTCWLKDDELRVEDRPRFWLSVNGSGTPSRTDTESVSSVR